MGGVTVRNELADYLASGGGVAITPSVSVVTPRPNKRKRLECNFGFMPINTNDMGKRPQEI
jgi:hypothetical protein